MNTERKTKNEKRTIKTLFPFAFCVLTFSLLVGCQQKMATQPAPRPYEESKMFAHGQSARPLVGGTVHRSQFLSNDPLVTWLTADGQSPKHTDNYKTWLDQQVNLKYLNAGDRDGLLSQTLPQGAPTNVKNFVETVPFEMTAERYARGQELYTAICSECHGGAGHANGKIPERGFLRPPSYHLDPEGKAKDWSRYRINGSGELEPDYTGNPQGTSRGFYKYGFEVPVKELPLGYIYQVITWGYGGMASHETQIPHAEDRWMVAAFVRGPLVLSQGFDAAKLTPEMKKKLANEGQKKAEPKKAEEKH